MSVRYKVILGLLWIVLVNIGIVTGCSGGGGANDVVAQAQTSAPVITIQPASQTVTTGQTATFSVTTIGTAPLGYQWKKNNTSISGATQASYTTPATTTSNNGDTFTVVITNGAGSVTSNPATLTVSAANLASQITQYGITWTFDKAYSIGQFVNGDYYVIADEQGKVKIISINPPSSSSASRHMNGSQINPVPIQTGVEKRFTHGYDAAVGANGYYDSSLNVALDVSSDKPLILSSGSSLVSTISRVSAGGRGQLTDASVLTVLASAPPAGSFRPPYSGSDKTIRFNISDIHTSILPVLSQTGISHRFNDNLDVGSFTAMIKRCWLDHFIHQGAGVGYVTPTNNLPDYGREYSTFISEASIVACLSDAELTALGITRNDILIGLIQIGIDNYEVLLNGGYWPNNGGCQQGRKWPILFAGALLGGATAASGRAYDMLHVKDFVFPPKYFYYAYGAMTTPFAEDQTISYLVQSDYDATHIAYWGNQSHTPYVGPDTRDTIAVAYETTDFGMPEWGIVRQTDPKSSNKYWGTEYRTDCTGNAYAGIALVARMLESTASTMTLWSNKAFFDYVDRFMAIQTKNDWQRSMSRFAGDMWDKYRAAYGDGYIGQVYINGTTVITNCVNATTGYDGVTGTRVSGATDTTSGFAVNNSVFSAINGFTGNANVSIDANHYRIYGDCAAYGIVK